MAIAHWSPKESFCKEFTALPKLSRSSMLMLIMLRIDPNENHTNITIEESDIPDYQFKVSVSKPSAKRFSVLSLTEAYIRKGKDGFWKLTYSNAIGRNN